MFTKIAIVCGPQQFTNELPMTSSHFLITAGSVRCPPNKNLPFIYLIGGLEHFLFSIIYGMSSFPMTNSYFSRWLKLPTGYTSYWFHDTHIFSDQFFRYQKTATSPLWAPEFPTFFGASGSETARNSWFRRKTRAIASLSCEVIGPQRPWRRRRRGEVIFLGNALGKPPSFSIICWKATRESKSNDEGLELESELS